MKTLRLICAMLIGTIASVAGWAQSSNRLFVPDVDAPSGKSVQLPVNVNNTDEFVALQLDITLPDGFVGQSQLTFTDRAADHEGIMRSTGSGAYRIMVYSPTNQAFRANSGTIFYINVDIPTTYGEGTVLPITLSNVTLSDIQGENVLTAAVGGRIFIKASADLEVSNVTCAGTELEPGTNINVAWTISNVGTLASNSGWKEEITLVKGEKRKSLATLYYNEPISSGAIVQRQADITLPTTMGIDGEAYIEVKAVPYSDNGEPVSALSNNTALTASPVIIAKRLYLYIPEAINENIGIPVRCSITRSGDTSLEEFFSFAMIGDSRITVPATVTLRSGVSSTYFYIEVANDEVIDDETNFSITASGNEYPSAIAVFTVIDDEIPDVEIASSKEVVTEGEVFNLVITLERAPKADVEAYIYSDMPRRFAFQSPVTIVAGQTTISVPVQAIDNDEVESDDDAEFRVLISGYEGNSCLVTLQDNDLPEIQLTIAPDEVNESAGVNAIVAKLRRLSNTNANVTIVLSDDTDGRIYYPSKRISMPKGTEEITFNIGVIDNNIVDGDIEVTISAAVYFSSCSCEADKTSKGYVTASLKIIDDDGAALSIAISPMTWLEGSTNGIVTVTRNTSTSDVLEVTLNSDHDDMLVYEHAVTIPAGDRSVTVPVQVKSNDTSDDGTTVVFTASADGLAAGKGWVSISDQTLPDAAIVNVETVASQIEVNGYLGIVVTVKNEGVAAIPAQTPINIYISGIGGAVSKAYLPDAIAPGQTGTATKTVVMPGVPGQYQITCVVNEDRAVKELSYFNNTYDDTYVAVTPSFTATVTVDKTKVLPGEAVTISGVAIGSKAANAEVEIYVIGIGRQVISVTTDDNGNFTGEWTPFSQQCGRFAIGACYPGEKLTDEQAVVDVYGLSASRFTSGIEPGTGETVESKFTLTNKGSLPITDLKCEVVSAPDNCVVDLGSISDLAAGEATEVSFSLTGTAPSPEQKYYEVVFNVTSAEGVTAQTTAYFYCRELRAQLKASVAKISTTMVKGGERDYPIIISNNGKRETGKITLQTPSWMSCATPQSLASLATGEQATVVLRLTPTDDMVLNHFYTGAIAILCENGDGISLPYSIEAVSDVNGTLMVDVTDEYTYYTDEAPHVAGAKVAVKHPITDVVIAEGVSDQNGIFSVVLPEGYYKLLVTEDHHSSYSTMVLIDPSSNILHEAFLPIDAVTVSWDVKETEIEDVYEIVTTVQYETNVPAPVVIIESPAERPEVGQIFPVIATNKGLITAIDNQFSATCTDGYEIEILNDSYLDKLAPQQSHVFYCVLKEKGSQRYMVQARANSDIPCLWVGLTLVYGDMCKKGKEMREANERRGWGNCMSGGFATGWLGFGGPGGSGGGGGGNGGGIGSPSGSPSNPRPYEENPQTEKLRKFLCSKCPEALANAALGCAPLPDFIGCPLGVATGCLPPALVNEWTVKDAVGCGLSILGCVPGVVGKVAGIGGCLMSLADVLEECFLNMKPNLQAPAREGANYEFKTQGQILAEALVESSDIFVPQVEALDNIFVALFGSREWLECESFEVQRLLEYMMANESSNGSVSIDDNLIARKPEALSTDAFLYFIERYNNSVTGATSSNKIDLQAMVENRDIIVEQEQKAQALGFDNALEMWNDALDELQEFAKDQSNSVCSTITLQFKQTMTMTRQAFRGTLTITNGSKEMPIEDINVMLEVRDEYGDLAYSDKFAITVESLDGMKGEMSLDSGWSVDPSGTGSANILFIPTKIAAPEAPINYSFGGSVSYKDPYSGLVVTRDLFPVTLAVKPSPELNLTYFMQRDVLGDDPLTLDVVEPMVPAEFSLLISNIGNGDATNVRMVTQQPEIIDNERGLLIDFELLSSLLNGKEETLALGESVPTEFGNIPAKSSMWAQWMFTSTLLGHFIDYKVEATHLTSYGNENLTLLNNVEIHELIRSLAYTDDSNQPGIAFLTNDLADSNDLPDHIYTNDGLIEEVGLSQTVAIDKSAQYEYTLSITDGIPGWMYGKIADPTAGRGQLASVTRISDGKQIDLRNFWQTDRTLRDGRDPLYEKMLHFADRVTGPSESYRLVFEPLPDLLLEVAQFVGVPNNDNVQNEQITEVTVVFNKPIDPATFTVDDITLACQAKQLDTEAITIAKISDYEYKLDLKDVTTGNGYYVLTVQAAGITDLEGYNGLVGKQTTWIQYAGGMVELTFNVSPEDAGTVVPQSGKVQYGDEISITATPATGYEFSHWLLDDVQIQGDASTQIAPIADGTYTAVFQLQHFNLDVDYNPEAGAISGGASGIYEYGDVVRLSVDTNPEFWFEYWSVGDEAYYDTELEVVINDDAEIEVKFYDRRSEQTFDLAEGWTWISHNLENPMSCTDMGDDSNITRILSQDGEMIQDPELGFVGTFTSLSSDQSYKVETDGASNTKSTKGLIILPTTPIPVYRGWNWISYLIPEPMGVAEAFAITENEVNDYIVGQAGFAQFTEEGWVGTLETMTPGEGYLYRSESDKVIRYNKPIGRPINAPFKIAPQRIVELISPWTVNVHKYPQIMCLVATLCNEAGNAVPSEAYAIGAFCGEECRGIGKIVNGMVMMSIHGNTGDEITLRAFDAAANAEYPVGGIYAFGERMIGSVSAPAVLTIDRTSSITSIVSGCIWEVNVTDRVLKVIAGPISDIRKVVIVNMNGYTVISEDGISAKGISLLDIPAGVYAVTIESSVASALYKIVVK